MVQAPPCVLPAKGRSYSQAGQKRLRFNDDQRRRLAAKAKGLGRKPIAAIFYVGYFDNPFDLLKHRLPEMTSLFGASEIES
jgi:hypothetical protein